MGIFAVVATLVAMVVATMAIWVCNRRQCWQQQQKQRHQRHQRHQRRQLFTAWVDECDKHAEQLEASWDRRPLEGLEDLFEFPYTDAK